MSKKDKAEKAKGKEAEGTGDTKAFDKAQAAYEAAKKTRQDARKALEEFEKKNGLQPKKKHGDNEKHGKAWKPLNKVWKEAKEAEEKAEAAMKALKPKKARESGKYDYPADCVTADDKKKFRAAARAAAKKAAKGDAPAKEKTEKKKSKEKAEPAEEAPAKEGKDKKKKKKDKAASKED